jgi:hypothetical protein
VTAYQPNYSRFHIFQDGPSEFTLLDEKFGWVWKGISSRSTVYKMMEYIETIGDFKDEQYKRIRRLDGSEWEREFKEG